MAIFGSWGRGKTDVLQRLKQTIDEKFGKDIVAIEANPWSSGHASLLQAVAMAVLQYKPIDDHTRASLKRISKIGFLLANRFVLQRASGVDFENLTSDIDSILSSGDRTLSPAAAAAAEIDKLAHMCFPGKKLVILIDDMDRCPPEWQRPMLESLYFLKLCKQKIVFVCAIDQRTLGHVDIPYHGLDEAGSLCAKIFDLVHDLPRADAELSTYARQRLLEADRMLGDSISGRLEYIVSDWDKYASPTNIGTGMCCASELATPRTVERSISRLRTICYVVQKPLAGSGLQDAYTAQGFGLAFSLRDRFPTIGRAIAEELPNMLERVGRERPHSKKSIATLRDYINGLPQIQRDTLFQALTHAHVSVDPENPGNTNQAEKIANGMHLATYLCKLAVV